MRIRPIQIVACETGWRVKIDPINEKERVGSHPPSHLGFYHAPAGMPLNEAVKKLRDCMVEKYEKQIKCLTRAVDGLKRIDTDEFTTEKVIL